MSANDSGLTFFLDRGLGSRIVPGLLRGAGWHILTMDEHYGPTESQAIDDVVWLSEATGRGDVVLCKDLAIARNQLEAETVHRVGARVFGLSNANLPGPDAAGCLLCHESAIVSMALRAQGPYVVAVSREGLRRCRLNLGRR